MIDLERQIHDLVEASFDAVPETTAAEVLGGAGSVGHRRRWPVAVAAALVVALVAAVTVVVVDRDDPGSRVGSGPSRRPAAIDTDPVPSDPGEWSVDLGGAIPYPPVVVAGAVVVVSSSSDFSQSQIVALEVAGSDVDPTTAARRWSVDLGSPVISDPVAAKNLVLVRLADDRLVALDAADGTERWSAVTGPADKAPSPVVGGSSVFVASVDGQVESFDASDGRVRWRRRLDEGVVAQPTFAEGRLYVGTAQLPVGDESTGHLAVFDTDGTRRRWVAVRGPVTSTPGGDRRVGAVTTSYVSRDGRAERFSAVDIVAEENVGESPFEHRYRGRLSAAYVFGQRVVIAWEGQLIAHRANTSAAAEWTASIGSNQSTEVIRHGPQVVATGGDALVALELSSGRQRWRAPIGDAYLGTSDDPGFLVGISRTTGSLVVVDAADGSTVLDFALHDAPVGAVLERGGLVWVSRSGRVSRALVDAAGS